MGETAEDLVWALTDEQLEEVLVAIVSAAEANECPAWLKSILNDYSLIGD